MTGAPLLSVTNLTVAFRSHTIVAKLSFKVDQGDGVATIGLPLALSGLGSEPDGEPGHRDHTYSDFQKNLAVDQNLSHSQIQDK